MAYSKKPSNGNKPKYTSADQIVGLIDDYFKSCEGELLRDGTGDPVLTKWGEPIYINRRPPTVTGLALALGFTSRVGLLRYQGKKEFTEVIERAKTRIEMYAEERLYDKEGSNGARFSLQFNFKGWQKEESEEDKGPAITIINDIPKVTAEHTDTAVFNPLKDPEKEEAEKEEAEKDGKA